MAKNFGMSAIDLQVKYGNDREHVERLQKQKWKEEDEQEKLATHYRDGVYKALAHKRKLDEKKYIYARIRVYLCTYTNVCLYIWKFSISSNVYFFKVRAGVLKSKETQKPSTDKTSGVSMSSRQQSESVELRIL
ncbi:unnamed protein product [Angiostrongylus costaricensis]|uniref:Kinase n=1 Tax=Angiostrongylus costaricensis TaxID=334426 RepID=A0A0R3PR38_ANGCS|nr:unnamed protein product [Angiostrongylus costaricensis]